jgi:hypothetical protein
MRSGSATGKDPGIPAAVAEATGRAVVRLRAAFAVAPFSPLMAFGSLPEHQFEFNNQGSRGHCVRAASSMSIRSLP